MRGSLILDRIDDPYLRERWRQSLGDLRIALNRLDNLLETEDPRLLKAQYLEAVLQFAEARDHERNFFWDMFIEQRLEASQMT
jgi:hypothetical protein